MANDPYSDCPCGSGKKLKFCCADILPEMQKAYALRENQPEQALKHFRELAEKHPQRESVVREYVGSLLDAGQVNAAHDQCVAFLEKKPDCSAIMLPLAEIVLQRDGFASARRLLHRTFQLCARSNPEMLAWLASRIAGQMLNAGQILSAREHLAFAVRMSRGEMQQKLLMQMLQLEGNNAVPLLFRSPYQLQELTGDEAFVSQELRARKLSALGCWEPAAIIYNRLADAAPTDGKVWYNLGLCRLWDARSEEAASSLHHAATLLQDRQLAVEAESLAQMLDMVGSEDNYGLTEVRLDLQSVSEAVTRLKDHQSVRSSEQSDHSECNHPPGVDHVAELVLLASDIADEEHVQNGTLPEAISDIDVYDVTDASQAESASISSSWISLTSSDSLLDDAVVKIRGILGDLITTSADEEQRRRFNTQPAIQRAFDRRFFRPQGMSHLKFRELQNARNSEPVDEWLAQPQSCLDNSTPAAAAGRADLSIKLEAALTVMLCTAIMHDVSVDEAALRNQLGLPELKVAQVDEQTSIAGSSVITLIHTDPAQLTPQQAGELVNRSSLLGLTDQVSAAIDRLRDDDELFRELGNVRLLLMQSAILRNRNQPDRSFELLDEARSHLPKGTEGFRSRLELDVRELSYRLDNPDDPQLPVLLRRFRNEYLHKVPELDELIRSQLVESGCQHFESELSGAATGAAESGQLWTPGEEPKKDGDSKLWIPGQS